MSAIIVTIPEPKKCPTNGINPQTKTIIPIAIGVIAFVAYVVYVQVENYVVTPRIMKRTLAVPGAVTIISALIGSSLLGLVGGLLAVPVAASIILILDEVVIQKLALHCSTFFSASN